MRPKRAHDSRIDRDADAAHTSGVRMSVLINEDALSGIASTTCSASQSASIGERSLLLLICSTKVARRAVQFFDLSADIPCLARASSAAPPADLSAGINTRKVSFTSLERDLGAVILGEVPFDQSDLQMACPRAADRPRCALTSAAVSAEHDHQIVGARPREPASASATARP